MDTLVGILVFAAITAIFVKMVRRANAKGRDLQELIDDKPERYVRPEPLSKEQRKALNFGKNQPREHKVKSSSGVPDTKPSKAAVTPTRAISKGWSVGQVEFLYEDAEGDITFRTVTVHSVTRSYLKGECHYRRAERTFRIDRIIGDLTNCETGEILSPKQWASDNA